MNNEEFYNKYDATILDNIKILGFITYEYSIIFASKHKIHVLPFELDSKYLIFDLGIDPFLVNDKTREFIYREAAKFGEMERYYVDKENNILSNLEYGDLDLLTSKKFKCFYRKKGEQ